MIFVDGNQESGSGTIVRYSVALAALLGQKLELANIRSRRDKPGLRAQHLATVRAVADLCGGKLEGAKVGANSILFSPTKPVSGGSFDWDIGTSGSTTMLAFTLLPLGCFATGPLNCRITGGLFQDFAPSAFHMQHVLLPILRKMGVQADLEIIRPGYVPRGGGVIELRLAPAKEPLSSLELPVQGEIESIEGIAMSSHLEARKVSERMAEECQRTLRSAGFDSSIRPVYEATALQSGAALSVWARTDAGCIIGADGAGARGRLSEDIGRGVAGALIEDLASGASVDRFVADQLIVFAALAKGTTCYRIPNVTEHVKANLWMVKTLLGAKSSLEQDGMVRIEGVGWQHETSAGKEPN